jgi:hypothetical protein
MALTLNKPQVPSAPETLDRYIELVNRCARDRLNHPIANGSPVHARILIAKLFETAQSDIRLVSGTLRQSNRDGVEIYAYKPVIDQAIRFLRQPGSKLSITIQTGDLNDGENNVFLRSVSDDKDRQGDIAVSIPKPGVLGDEVPHFMEADAATYRLETGADAKPSNQSIAAIANFGDVKTAKSLADYYADISEFLKFDGHILHRVCVKPGEHFSLA